MPFRRHCCVRIEPGDSNDQPALLALARHDDFAVLVSLEHAFEAVQVQAGFGSIAAMTADAGLVENGPDILAIGESLLFGGSREFAEVQLGGS